MSKSKSKVEPKEKWPKKFKNSDKAAWEYWYICLSFLDKTKTFLSQILFEFFFS